MLGLDGVHVAQRQCCLLTDLAKRQVVDLLPAIDQRTLSAYLSALPNRETIEVAVIDMSTSFRQVITRVLPGARIVIDRFHLVQLAGACLKRLRLHIKEQLSHEDQRALLHDRYLLFRRLRDLEARDLDHLEHWKQQLPLLAEAYLAKEAFADLWQSSSREEAISRYTAWQRSLSPSLCSTFHPVLTALERWHAEVFAFFEAPFTNGFTEAVNGHLKAVNWQGKGYGYAAIRAKLLLAPSPTSLRAGVFVRTRDPEPSRSTPPDGA